MAYEQYGFNDNKTKYDLSSLTEIQNRIANIETTILNRVYPVGCVYWSKNKVNPGRPASEGGLGIGTWAKVSTQQRLIAVIDPDNKQTGALATGGSNTVKILPKNLPDHAHRIDTTKEDANIYEIKRPWGNVRVIPMGTGDVSGVEPYHLAYRFRARRGEGSGTDTVNKALNTTVTNDGDVQWAKSIQVTSQQQPTQVVDFDITNYTKIEGFTGDGIYTQSVYENTTQGSNKKYSWVDLTQEDLGIVPAYITLYAWYRTA